jgi:hypothetical protein
MRASSGMFEVGLEGLPAIEDGPKDFDAPARPVEPDGAGASRPRARQAP